MNCEVANFTQSINVFYQETRADREEERKIVREQMLTLENQQNENRLQLIEARTSNKLSLSKRQKRSALSLHNHSAESVVNTKLLQDEHF